MQVKILPHQWEFLNSKKKYCLLSGGIGSGKSFAGSWYAVLKAKDNPKVKGLIGANTYKQLTQSTLAALFGVLMDMGIEFKYNQNKGILSLFDTEILCVSLDNYNSLRGVEIGWFWIDETRDTKEDAFKVLMGRLRDNKCNRLEGRLTSSPSGFDWMYDYFIGDKKTDSFQVIKAKTNDNYHLPDEYAEDLKASYDSKLYAQEVEGEFINMLTQSVLKKLRSGLGWILTLILCLGLSPTFIIILFMYSMKYGYKRLIQTKLLNIPKRNMEQGIE